MAHSTRTRGLSDPARRSTAPALRILGELLCIAVAVIHVIDQKGFPGEKQPTYIQVLYYVLEAAGVVAALMLLVPTVPFAASAWVLAFGVALGPIVAYVLSRSTGLPNYSDDKGNWGEPIGVISLIVEGVLLLLALSGLGQLRVATSRAGRA